MSEYNEQVIRNLEVLKEKLDTQLQDINTAIAKTKDDGAVATLLHTQEKLHDNKRVADLEIQIHKLQMELDVLLKKHKVV